MNVSSNPQGGAAGPSERRTQEQAGGPERGTQEQADGPERGTQEQADAFERRTREQGAPKRRTQAERAESTRAALIAAARRLFTERGYDAVGSEEIVRAAGVTRGALYHHFGGKPGLLEAAYEQLEAESTKRVAGIVLGSGSSSPLEAMKAGVEAFLDECAEPELSQIALHDAPAVLGWERWREIGAAHGLGLIEASLSAAIEAGEIRPLPVKPLAHLLLGALDEAAMLIARSDDPVARAEVTAVLLALLESFAVSPTL